MQLLHDEEYHQNKHMSLEEENFTEHNILALPHHNSNIIPNVTQDAEKQCLFVQCQCTLASCQHGTRQQQRSWVSELQEENP